MKRIISILALFCIMSLSVSSLVTYTGQPQFPYIIYGFVNWQSQALNGARIELTNVNTGYVSIVSTNADGYWQEEGSNWQTTSSARPPILFGDVIKIKTLDGCGSADTCEKSFSAFGTGFENFASVDLSVTGALIPPPSSSGGSGGSGGGGGGGAPIIWNCPTEWSSCVDGKQTQVCTQPYFNVKRTDTRVCTAPVVIPTPESIVDSPIVVTPNQPPIQYTCSDGTVVDIKENCPIQSKEHEQIIVNQLLSLKNAGLAGAVIVALTIGLYLWRRRKGKFITAEKGAKTFINKRTK